MVVIDHVIATSAAVIEMASNVILLANLAKELVALMIRSKSRTICDSLDKCDESPVLLQF